MSNIAKSQGDDGEEGAMAIPLVACQAALTPGIDRGIVSSTHPKTRTQDQKTKSALAIIFV
jgi:hypothetical protein